MIGLGLLVLAVLLFVFHAGGLRRRTLTIGRPMRVEALAVLPFENLSENTSQEYFAEGLTDALNADLSKVGVLRVVARPTVNQYKRDIEIACRDRPRIERRRPSRRFNCAFRRPRESATVQLIRPAEDRTLWGNSYDRGLFPKCKPFGMN